MKITGLETFLVKPRWLFLKVSTDAGLVGWGEPAVNGRPAALRHAVEELRPRVIGQDPEAIEALWLTLCRGAAARLDAPHMAAVSGLEQALWDLKGKACQLPVYQLLGGACRPRVRLSTACGGLPPHDAAFQAKGLRLKGYTAMTVEIEEPAPHLHLSDYCERILARLTAIRGEAGRSVDVALDFGGRLSLATVRHLLPQLEPLVPLFLEDLCPPDLMHEQLRLLSTGLTPPIANGRQLATRWAFRDLLEQRAATVLRPDIGQVGGMLELRKLAAMAEPFGVTVAPRGAGGPIALAAAIHVNSCIPNFLIQEHPGMPNKWDLGLGYLATPLVMREGGIEAPRGPGLGIEIIEDALRERAMDPEPGHADAPRQEPHGRHA